MLQNNFTVFVFFNFANSQKAGVTADMKIWNSYIVTDWLHIGQWHVVLFQCSSCVTIWWYVIIWVWSQEGTVLSSLGWAPTSQPPWHGSTQLPAHQSLSFLACVPFCVEQIPNLTVFKNHYFIKHVGLKHCACNIYR